MHIDPSGSCNDQSPRAWVCLETKIESTKGVWRFSHQRALTVGMRSPLDAAAHTGHAVTPGKGVGCGVTEIPTTRRLVSMTAVTGRRERRKSERACAIEPRGWRRVPPLNFVCVQEQCAFIFRIRRCKGSRGLSPSTPPQHMPTDGSTAMVDGCALASWRSVLVRTLLRVTRKAHLKITHQRFRLTPAE